MGFGAPQQAAAPSFGGAPGFSPFGGAPPQQQPSLQSQGSSSSFGGAPPAGGDAGGFSMGGRTIVKVKRRGAK